jgi:NTE family protein
MDSTLNIPAEPGPAAETAAHTSAQPMGMAAPRPVGQVVLVFQGGGALGAYQAGVYQALHEHGVEPDWIIGTSICAINASLIAGNAPTDRLARLEEFWRRVQRKEMWGSSPWLPLADTASYWATVFGGIPGFFAPNPLAFLGAHVPLGADRAGLYSTVPLERTLDELVDFSRLEACKPRLTVGAAHVRTSQMRYFDSRQCAITARHIMASGALPPAFPGVRINGELYWDGGILSNTPTEAIFEDNPRRDSLIFAVHMWNPMGPEPGTLLEVLNRQKDIQYSSRVAAHIARQRQVHKLRHVVSELVRSHSGERTPGRSGAESRRLWLRDADARGPAAGAAPRQREPHQGHRLQPVRHSPPMGGRLSGHRPRPRASALAGQGRSARRGDRAPGSRRHVGRYCACSVSPLVSGSNKAATARRPYAMAANTPIDCPSGSVALSMPTKSGLRAAMPRPKL